MAIFMLIALHGPVRLQQTQSLSEDLHNVQNTEDIFKMFFGGQNMGAFYEDPVSSGKVGHNLQANLR